MPLIPKEQYSFCMKLPLYLCSCLILAIVLTKATPCKGDSGAYSISIYEEFLSTKLTTAITNGERLEPLAIDVGKCDFQITTSGGKYSFFPPADRFDMHFIIGPDTAKLTVILNEDSLILSNLQHGQINILNSSHMRWPKLLKGRTYILTFPINPRIDGYNKVRDVFINNLNELGASYCVPISGDYGCMKITYDSMTCVNFSVVGGASHAALFFIYNGPDLYLLRRIDEIMQEHRWTLEFLRDLSDRNKIGATNNWANPDSMALVYDRLLWNLDIHEEPASAILSATFWSDASVVIPYTFGTYSLKDIDGSIEFEPILLRESPVRKGQFRFATDAEQPELQEESVAETDSILRWRFTIVPAQDSCNLKIDLIHDTALFAINIDPDSFRVLSIDNCGINLARSGHRRLPENLLWVYFEAIPDSNQAAVAALIAEIIEEFEKLGASFTVLEGGDYPISLSPSCYLMRPITKDDINYAPYPDGRTPQYRPLLFFHFIGNSEILTDSFQRIKEKAETDGFLMHLTWGRKSIKYNWCN